MILIPLFFHRASHSCVASASAVKDSSANMSNALVPLCVRDRWGGGGLCVCKSNDDIITMTGRWLKEGRCGILP